MPYASRALRTEHHLLIRNFKPDRLPMGDLYDPAAKAEDLLQNHYLAYPDMDASPTKAFLMTNQKTHAAYFDFAFSARPAFELYDLKNDPDQVNNVAANPDHAEDLNRLQNRMMSILRETGDPRVIGDGTAFDKMPYVDPDHPPRAGPKRN